MEKNPNTTIPILAQFIASRKQPRHIKKPQTTRKDIQSLTTIVLLFIFISEETQPKVDTDVRILTNLTH